MNYAIIDTLMRSEQNPNERKERVAVLVFVDVRID